MDKKIVGLIEPIKINGKKSARVLALFDTGAYMTSVDIGLANELGLGPVLRNTTVKNPSIKERIKRPVVEAELVIRRKKFKEKVNLQDRSHMKFPVIIGRNILCGNFIVDPNKNIEFLKTPKKTLNMLKN